MGQVASSGQECIGPKQLALIHAWYGGMKIAFRALMDRRCNATWSSLRELTIRKLDCTVP